MVGFAGQQTVRALGNGIGKQAAARAADDRQPVHRLPGVGKLHLHRWTGAGALHSAASFLRLAASSGTVICSMSPPGRSHLQRQSSFCMPKMPGQHLVHAALGGIQIGVHTDGGNARLHQLERHILRASFFERVKDDRVVRHDDRALLCGGSCHHLRG